jgi:cytochrome c peroxidase
VHTDFFARSWVPFRAGDPRRDELRNSPTLLDAALMPRLHFDGEFDSLDSLVKGTLAGRPMGWLPGEEDKAFDHLRRVIVNDNTRGGGSSGYRAQFIEAFGADPVKLTAEQLIGLVTRAISDYMRTLNSARTTAYDRFIRTNGLDEQPEPGEDPKAFGRRILDKIESLEGTRGLKWTPGFDRTSLAGMKAFFRTDGAGAGNCVACHTPPLFTDFSFHNMGISQSEYDQVHGEGSFAALDIPNAANARRPSPALRETPSRGKPGLADLGHWNFVDLKTSTLRRPGQSDDEFLRRMIATFKTPTLRNLAFSQPYMHTGGFTTLESALGELLRLSDMARAGKVREGDDELARIRITEADIAPLVAFLSTLNQEITARKY